MNRPSGVETVRQELLNNLDRYNLIADALAGEKAVKAKKETYLPRPNDVAKGTAEGEARYASYLLRAVYYNVIKSTQDALVGQLFLRPPKVKLPAELEVIATDANGEGLNLEQLVRRAANHVLPYGRCGLLADFPRTNGEVTVEDVENGVRPTIKFYEPWAIINWRTAKVNNKKQLVLLVLQEMEEYESATDSFVVEIKKQYRVYRLKDGVVTVEVWVDRSTTKSEVTMSQFPSILIDGEANPFTEIPFEFIGSENNDSEMDEPPLYSMATLNIAHFRNSADYEESVFLVGQPTPVYSGLTEDWVTNHFNGGVPFGSRASVPLPENATAQLLQAEGNTLAFAAMEHKEHQMIAIGAKIINPSQTVERREAEIQIEDGSQRSVLMTIKENLEKAFLAVLKRSAAFVRADVASIELELNDNFDLTSLTAEELNSLTELYAAKALDSESLHENLRRSGIVKKTFEEWQAALVDDLAFHKKVNPVEPTTKTGDTNPDSKVQ